MDTSTTLVLKGFSGVPEITPDANKLKLEALSAAGAIKQVKTEEEQLVAVTAMRKLKDLRIGMEATRKAVKAPVLRLEKDIDALARDFLEETNREEQRLEGLVSHYQRKLLEARREEEARLAREAAETERLQREAEQKRAAGEIKQAESLEAAALEAQLASELSSDLAVPEQKPHGLVVKARLNFQITDPHVFCQAYPQFFQWNEKSEYLKLKRQDVLDELNREDGKGVFHMAHFPEELPEHKQSRVVRPPGARVFEETRSHVR